MSWLEAKTSLHQQGRKVNSCQMLKKNNKRKRLTCLVFSWNFSQTACQQQQSNAYFSFPEKKTKKPGLRTNWKLFFFFIYQKKGFQEANCLFFCWTKTLWGLEQEQDFKPSETELFLVSLSFFTFSLFGNKRKLFPFSPFGNKKNSFLFCLGQVA